MMHVLEEIQVPADVPLPQKNTRALIQPGFSVVAFWTRSDPKKAESFSGRLSLIGPKREKLGSAEVRMDLGEIGRSRQINRFAAFPYAGPGQYSLEAHMKTGEKWKRVGAATLIVKQEQPKSTSVDATKKTGG
jgi:hypothetical protein